MAVYQSGVNWLNPFDVSSVLGGAGGLSLNPPAG